MRLSHLRWAGVLFGLAIVPLIGCGGDSVSTPPPGEGEGEGQITGEGEGEGDVEGQSEGEGEGAVEGEGEGAVEGEGEGAPVCVAGASQPCDCGNGQWGTQFCMGGQWGNCINCAVEGEGEGAPGCTPNETRNCMCRDGSQGQQTCSADGSTWGSCAPCGTEGEGEGAVEGEGEGAVEGEGEGQEGEGECDGGAFAGWGQRGLRATLTEEKELFTESFEDGDFDAFHLTRGAAVQLIDNVNINHALVMPANSRAETWGMTPETWNVINGKFKYHLEANAKLTFCFHWTRATQRGYCVVIDANNWTLQRREGQAQPVQKDVGVIQGPWQRTPWTFEVAVADDNRIVIKREGNVLIDFSEPAPLVQGGMLILNEGPANVWIDDIEFKTTQFTEETWKWTGGPQGAAVTAVAVDPDNPREAYVGTLAGGLYKTTNAGQGWTEIGLANGLQATSIRKIVIDPNNSSLIYVGTASHRLSAFWVTRDKGLHWNYTGATELEPLADAWAVTMHPVQNNRVFASFGIGGVMQTGDGGATWAPMNSGGGHIGDIAVSPRQPLIMWAGSRNGQGLRLSSDGGATWGPAMGQQQGKMLPMGDVQKVIAPTTNQDTAYVLTGGQIYFTTDKAQTWTLMEGRDDVTAITFIPGDPARLCAVGGGFNCTTDNGETWSPLADVPDGREIAWCKTVPSTMYIATFHDNVAVSQDSGATWTWGGAGLKSQNVKGLAIDMLNPNIVYATGADGLYRSADGGASWTMTLEGDFNVVAVDPSDSSVVLVGGNEGSVLYRTTDGGGTWADVSAGIGYQGVMAIAYSWSDSSKVLVGTGHGPGEGAGGGGLYRSTNCGQSWAKVASVPDVAVPAILIEHQDSSKVHVGTLGEGYFYSDNGGSSFQRRLNVGLPNQQQSRRIWALAQDRMTPGTLYLGTNSRYGGLEYESPFDGVYKSVNGGQAFTGLLTNNPADGATYQMALGCGIEAILVDPWDSGRVFISICDVGVLHSINDDVRRIHKTAFQPYGLQTSMQHMNVHRLAISRDGEVLYGGTGGQGVFRNRLWAVE